MFRLITIEKKSMATGCMQPFSIKVLMTENRGDKKGEKGFFLDFLSEPMYKDT